MRRVLVMGLGRFGGGVAAVRWFRARGHPVLVTDVGDPGKLARSLAEIEPLGVELRLGGHEEADFDTTDIVVVNPAVPFDHPLVRRARARGKQVVTELGITLRHLKGPIVGVTGTKGKSTTASLVAAMLEASGRPVTLGGNIGRPLLNEAERLTAGTVAVLEVSSFQLAWLEHDDFALDAAIVTNVTGDHLDRHPTFGHYAGSKRRLVEAVRPGGAVVLREEDEVCRSFAAHTRGRIVWFGESRPPPIALDGLRLAGRHNLWNAAAAAHAALAVGATPEGCRAAIRDFRPLRHRLEMLPTHGDVAFVDDSIATTPEAAAAAVGAFSRPVILLTGGRDKGLDWGPLVRAADRAKAVIAYGETGPKLHERIPASQLRPGFDAAVRRALEIARPGDVVLLSPGFASYDEFPGFDARGDRFRELIGAPL
ncbi:MAG TPA: UDP-N-acetylmuramoyl-L-alanine--D-glutamate ligase [Planctomycetota bacterium]|nr:UDP-N-acetylmuramoyl-L-alanine--D-glutamate ligase [Planctomycetota bacterium]